MSDIATTCDMLMKVFNAFLQGDVAIVEVAPEKWYCDECKEEHAWDSRNNKCRKHGATALGIIVRPSEGTKEGTK